MVTFDSFKKSPAVMSSAFSMAHSRLPLLVAGGSYFYLFILIQTDVLHSFFHNFIILQIRAVPQLFKLQLMFTFFLNAGTNFI